MTLKDPIPLADVVTLERAIREASEIEGASPAEYYAVILPGLLRCVEAWQLAGFPEMVTAETFPGTPRVESQRLLAWLADEVVKVYGGDGGDQAPLA